MAAATTVLDGLAGPARVVLGGRFGEEPRAASHRRLDLFRELGGRIVDTAHRYADGASEEVIGSWLRSRRARDEIVVVDKVCHPNDAGRSRVHPRTIREELTASLRRLGSRYVDVLLLHRDDPTVPVEDLVEALVREYDSGRIRAFGVSNWLPQRLHQFLQLALQSGGTAIASYQFSLAVPAQQIWPGALHADSHIIRIIRTAEAPLLAWAAQARGWFAVTAGNLTPTDTEAFDTPQNREAFRRCQALATDYKVEPATVALAWTLHQRLPIWVTVGPRTEEELEASMNAAELQLRDEEVAWLTDATSPAH